jgi:hypothetical protein
MVAHSSSMGMTSCLLDQLRRTALKGFTSFFLFYGRQDTKPLGKMYRFAKTLSNTSPFTCPKVNAGLALRRNGVVCSI